MKYSFVKLLFFISIFNVCISCEQKTQETKIALIPKDKMTAILIDLHTIDGVVNAYNTYEKGDLHLSKEFYDSVVFLKHGVSDSLFMKNIKYYAISGDLKYIYTKVLDSLNTKKAMLQQERKRTPNSKGDTKE